MCQGRYCSAALPIASDPVFEAPSDTCREPESVHPQTFSQSRLALSEHRPRTLRVLFDFVLIAGPAPVSAPASASPPCPPPARCQRFCVFPKPFSSRLIQKEGPEAEAVAAAAGLSPGSGWGSPRPRGDGRALSAFDIVHFADEMEIREMVWRYGDPKRVFFSLFRAGGDVD